MSFSLAATSRSYCPPTRTPNPVAGLRYLRRETNIQALEKKHKPVKDVINATSRPSSSPLSHSINRLREELSCSICWSLLFEPTTTSCGHNFCKKCLSSAIEICGNKCPNCRQPTSQDYSNAVNTVLWNTIRDLFPEQVKARQEAEALASGDHDASSSS